MPSSPVSIAPVCFDEVGGGVKRCRVRPGVRDKQPRPLFLYLQPTLVRWREFQWKALLNFLFGSFSGFHCFLGGMLMIYTTSAIL